MSSQLPASGTPIRSTQDPVRVRHTIAGVFAQYIQDLIPRPAAGP